MDFFAYAQEGERASQEGGLGAFIPLVLMLLIILLPIYLSERKKRRRVREAIRDAGASAVGDNLEGVESSKVSGRESQVEVTDEELALFVGPKAEKYLSKFRKFRAQGADRFALTWHWPAFLFVPFWMLYRRLYLWAIATILVGHLHPYALLPIMIISGMTANYIYYKRAKKRILSIKRTFQSSEKQGLVVLSALGGVNWVPIIVLGLIGLMGALGSIAIPYFHEYRVRTYDSEARSQMEKACERAQAFLKANPGGVVTLDELRKSGFEPARRIEIMIEDGTQENLRLVARHESGSKVYVTDHLCDIKELSR